MNNSFVSVKTDEARRDAKQIEKIVDTIADNMKTLDDVFERNIPEGIDTSWSNEVLTNWKSYYTSDIPEAMNEMRLSATNLINAVEAAESYSNSNM